MSQAPWWWLQAGYSALKSPWARREGTQETPSQVPEQAFYHRDAEVASHSSSWSPKATRNAGTKVPTTLHILFPLSPGLKIPKTPLEQLL